MSEKLDAWNARGPRLTSHEWVKLRLRRAIFAGAYAPGSRLVQTELAEAFQVSVTPVREAMRDLISEGLIRSDPHHAATVRELDVAEALEVNELRLMLEPFAVRRAAERITAGEIENLEQIQRNMERATDNQTWLELNNHFHLAVIDSARSPQVAGILHNLLQTSTFYFAAALRVSGGNRAKSIREHWDLIDALRAHDAELAASITAGHVSSSLELENRLDSLLSGSTTDVTTQV
jgi:DNA-binding GntR family transcriptional regulator